MRSSGSTTISFGLVAVPVKLYVATEGASPVAMNLLHQGCTARIKNKQVCSACNKDVEKHEIIKGYEYAKGQFVTFTAEELKALDEVATDSIEITEFVPSAAIDPVIVDKPYYLAPDKGGSKAYSLLAAALGQSGRVAVAKYVSRGKGKVAMIRAVGTRLVMHQLLFSDEVRSMKDVPCDDQPVRDAELALALKLIGNSARETFDHAAYKDEVTERVKDAINAKAAGQPIPAAAAPAPTSTVDLMAALQASLKAA